MVRKLSTLLVGISLLTGLAGTVWGHCQIPCGIYDDELRFKSMLEHVATIEKSMKQIESLGQEDKANTNQFVRWVTNKDAHADELTEIVTFYFMAQRVKPASKDDKAGHEKYVREVTLLHQVVVLAMKAKQTTDLKHCTDMRQLIGDFGKSYMGE